MTGMLPVGPGGETPWTFFVRGSHAAWHARTEDADGAPPQPLPHTLAATLALPGPALALALESAPQVEIDALLDRSTRHAADLAESAADAARMPSSDAAIARAVSNTQRNQLEVLTRWAADTAERKAQVLTPPPGSAPPGADFEREWNFRRVQTLAAQACAERAIAGADATQARNIDGVARILIASAQCMALARWRQLAVRDITQHPPASEDVAHYIPATDVVFLIEAFAACYRGSQAAVETVIQEGRLPSTQPAWLTLYAENLGKEVSLSLARSDFMTLTRPEHADYRALGEIVEGLGCRWSGNRMHVPDTADLEELRHPAERLNHVLHRIDAVRLRYEWAYERAIGPYGPIAIDHRPDGTAQLPLLAGMGPLRFSYEASERAHELLAQIREADILRMYLAEHLREAATAMRVAPGTPLAAWIDAFAARLTAPRPSQARSQDTEQAAIEPTGADGREGLPAAALEHRLRAFLPMQEGLPHVAAKLEDPSMRDLLDDHALQRFGITAETLEEALPPQAP